MSQGNLILAGLVLVITATVVQAQPLPALQADDLSWWAGLVAWLQQAQGELWRGLAKAIRAVKTEGSIAAASWLIGLSFLYGVLHAAGPGHGKAIISAYLVGNESAIRRGIALSLLSAAAQGLTAITLVGILAAVFGLISREVAGVATWLETASAWFIVGIGIWLTCRAGLSLWHGRKAHAHHHHHEGHDHGHCHDHHHHAHAVVAPNQASGFRQGMAIVAAIGARPCMGAIFVLLFSLAQGVFFLGILGTAAMSLGTGMTVAVLAALASGARATALRLAGSMDGWLERTYHALGIFGGVALVLLGLALAFQPAAPFPGAG